MSAVGYSGIGSFLFFIDETYFGGGGPLGTALVPVPPAITDKHIPINPTEVVEWETPQYEEYEVTLYGNSLPTRVSTVVAPGTLSLTQIYHAPFLLSRVFSTTTSGAWAADGTAFISMSMTNYERVNKPICMHIHLDNRETGADDIDENMYGGKCTSYKWEITTGEVLKEVVELEFGNTSTHAISMNTDANYHNGRFAIWDGQKVDMNDDVIAIAQNRVSITTTTDLDADIASIDSASIEIKTPHQTHVGLGYESQNFTAKNSYDVEAIVTAKIKGNKPIEEIRKRFETRTNIPFKFQVSNAGYIEYIQCTNMKLGKVGTLSIPDAAGDAVLQLEMTFKATSSSALTYLGYFQQSTTANPTSYLK